MSLRSAGMNNYEHNVFVCVYVLDTFVALSLGDRKGKISIVHCAVYSECLYYASGDFSCENY